MIARCMHQTLREAIDHEMGKIGTKGRQTSIFSGVRLWPLAFQCGREYVDGIKFALKSKRGNRSSMKVKDFCNNEQLIGRSR